MFEHFHGKVMRCGDIPCHAEPEIDLCAMARDALHYLKENPRPALGYECRFGINLIAEKVWSADDEHEVITVGDTDLRMLIEYRYMKEMSGDASAEAVREGVRARALSYLDGNGGCTVVSGCCNHADEPYSWPWAASKLLIALCDEYRDTKDETLRPFCRKMFEVLCRPALRTKDGICYPSGNGFYFPDGTPAVSNENPYSPAMQPEALAVYAETFSDGEALEFAHGLARGEVRGILKHHWLLNDTSRFSAKQKEQLAHMADADKLYTLPDHSDFLLLVRPDGSFDHHSHMRGHNVWGVSHIAYLTGDPELIAWCKKVLDFYLSRGTDYGWIPESMTYPMRSETCAVADVIDIALNLAKCGYPAYYDTAERFVRNYIRRAQFFVTDEYRRLYLKRHPGEAGERGIREAERIEGGFLGAVGINDRLFREDAMDMMGCCSPEGMRAIHSVWKNIVTEENGVISVNMNLPRKHPYADVETFSENGGVCVTAHSAGDYRIRLSDWAEEEKLTVQKNGMPTKDYTVKDGYVCFAAVPAGTEISVAYPAVCFEQKQAVKNVPGKPDREITVLWRGNTVLDVLPQGAFLPFYQG